MIYYFRTIRLKTIGYFSLWWTVCHSVQGDSIIKPLRYEPHRHYPCTREHFVTLPSFARIERPRWRPVELNDRHLRSHGKIGDCEQSNENLVWHDWPFKWKLWTGTFTWYGSALSVDSSSLTFNRMAWRKFLMKNHLNEFCDKPHFHFVPFICHVKLIRYLEH